MKNQHIRTNYILKKYGITRQTLYNWIKSGIIDKPKKDWRGWRMWTEQHILQIEEVINNKYETVSKKDSVKIDDTFRINNRRYLGSKYRLLPKIDEVVKEYCKGVKIIADIFAGTGVVADMFNKQGKKVIVNDILYSNYLSYHTWFGATLIDKVKIKNIIDEFNSKDIKEDNYFSENFSNTYFTLENARKIGYIREEIERLSNQLNFREKAILITSLIYAMDKVANTCGHYDAYRRKIDDFTKIKLLMPDLNDIYNSENEIYRKDANELVREIEADLIYIDTPYNSRQYSDMYHLLENVAEWKKPKVEGVAKKMSNRKHIKSQYCTSKAPDVFKDLIFNIKSKYILVSYNNMGNKGVSRSNAKISNEEIIEILSSKGNIKIFEVDFNPFTTGKTKIEQHKEILYLCECK